MIFRVLVVLLILTCIGQDLQIRHLDDAMRRADDSIAELQKQHNALCRAIGFSGQIVNMKTGGKSE